MLTFYHAPNSRSSTIATLIRELGARTDIGDRLETRIVTIPRIDGSGGGSGGRDPANPHPEGKVPALVHDGRLITERGAIILQLCALFPEGEMAPAPGTPDWGVFATWMTWYQGVLEPVLIFAAAGLSHDWLDKTFRGEAEAAARLRAALERGPWLMGADYSAADLLVHSPYAWFGDRTPADPLIEDWVERCKARPARLATIAADADLLAEAV